MSIFDGKHCMSCEKKIHEKAIKLTSPLLCEICTQNYNWFLFGLFLEAREHKEKMFIKLAKDKGIIKDDESHTTLRKT